MLNIKDPEAHDLAKQLAELEHTSMTEAVIRALRVALDEHGRRRQLRRQVLAGLIESARVDSGLLSESARVDSGLMSESARVDSGSRVGSSVFDELYDPETGLPR